MPLRTILFDLDETLLYEYASVDRTFRTVCEAAREAHGIDPAALSETVRRIARPLWRGSDLRAWILSVGVSSWEALTGDFAGEGPELARLREWTPGFRAEAWAGALLEHGVRDADLAARLADAAVAERRRHHVPYPDAAPTLDALRARGHRLAVVTNGPPACQREKLELSGLADRFDAVVVSGDLGVGKPDPRPFVRALELLGAGTDPVMVGDSLENDVAGARAAGITAVWLDREGREPDGPVSPDLVVRSLLALPDALNEAG